jgi:pyruvate dehydrogenase E2 component (dihydrolipoamide acetyltransferase)
MTFGLSHIYTSKYKIEIMAVAVIMPRQGQSVESCIITRWHKSRGDTVKEGDLLFSYETDKAAFDEDAKESGKLLEIFFDEGDEAPVLSNIAIIGSPGDNYQELIPDVRKGNKPVEKPSSGEKETTPATGKSDTHNEAEPGLRLRISPLARKVADELGISVQEINGSGPGGRIIVRDIRKSAETSIPDNDMQHQDSHEVKMSNIRKLISSKMQESLRNSAQLTHHMTADARIMLAWRKDIKAARERTGIDGITINDMVCYSVIRALKKHSYMNAHCKGENLRIFNKVHLGIAVDTDRGLMVPVVRNADDLNIEGLSGRIRSLVRECRKGSIDPDLLSSENAGFTITNLGSFGVEMFTPVLNLPQAGILGVNTITYRPADIGDGVIGIIPVIGLSLTYDHRAVDGGPASVFLASVKTEIENLDRTGKG